MGRFRHLADKAFAKLDEINAKDQERAVAKLSPAEREHYDAWVERTAALNSGVPQEELGDPKLIGKVLQGPAGEILHGVRKAPKAPPVIEDPAAWDAQSRTELAARDEARAPYLAPDRSPIRISRVGATEKSSLEEICAYLGSTGLASRSDLVFGATRVPHMIQAGRMKPFGSRYVEWDVVHASEHDLGPTDPATAISLDAEIAYVARNPGEPSPLDEDIALDVLTRAGLDPSKTLGISRTLRFEGRGGGDDDSGTPRRLALITGVDVLVPGDPAIAAMLRQAADSPRPWSVPTEPAPPNRIDVIQWDAIAQAVQPRRQHRATMPSPFPYLPTTSTELLRAHLEIVGIKPADCWSVQVTYDRPFDLMARTGGGFVRRTGGGPDFPSADGKPRQRMFGGHKIVVTYRDRPEYSAGRDRFKAYSREVLQANLDGMLNLRPPIPKPDGRLARAVDFAGDVALFFSMEPGVEDGFFPPRYCWPPPKR